MIDANDTRILAVSYRWHFWRVAIAIVAVLAAGCSDNRFSQLAGAPSADECQISAIALTAGRNTIDLEYQVRLDEWQTLEAERESIDTEWAALKDSKEILVPDIADGSEAAQTWTSAKSLTSEWESREAEWARIEAKLEVFIDAAAEAPAAADWPLDSRRHSDRWPDLFQRRTALNDEWSSLARLMSDLFKQISDLYGQAAAVAPVQTSPQADLARNLSTQFEHRAALYDRYASSTLRWAEHWRYETDWHQQAADLAWNCRYSSV